MTTSYMYIITRLRSGGYECSCRIQDGVEHYKEKDLETAIESLINSAKVLNGTTITEEDIYFRSQLRYNTAVKSDSLTTLLGQVEAEYKRASALHGNFSSTHEGYAVLKEEVDELWDGIKKNDSKRLLKEEAIQIAAMAIRFCTDICERN